MIGHLKAGQAPSGRMTVEGRIVALKLRESERWGVQCVMVVLSRLRPRPVRREAPGDFVSWTAEQTDYGSQYAVVESFIDVKGPFLVHVELHHSRVSFDDAALPPGGDGTSAALRSLRV